MTADKQSGILGATRQKIARVRETLEKAMNRNVYERKQWEKQTPGQTNLICSSESQYWTGGAGRAYAGPEGVAGSNEFK